ncbi:WD40 repeat-like protein [Cylindrobasidium torrendii FP15055 ss-10]|uniref:WD40 repeat-like protein n=1 Tax=Cylindrobasidium torrendii FP15055 ss-10 TaxID=1314674 RepID=A0A0D7BEC7_9AGAR|nr:WD40 repeat-like protein [Cylindrobasidium torrendii FP15055 ss-10]
MSASTVPYTQLLLSTSGPSIVLSGHHVQVINSANGEVLSSTSQLSADVQENLQKSGPLRRATLDPSRTFLATIADDKMLKVWDLSGTLKLASQRELPKKPTDVSFTQDGQTILVADKFGDVFRYSEVPPTENPPRDRGSLVSHDATSGNLILGHTSVLTSFTMSHDEKYVITADRDEHIRVSWYPQGFCIESYCLGSTKFVSALHIPRTHPSLLVSGGGDTVLKLWEWQTGELKYEIPIWGAVSEHIVVKVPVYKKRKDVEGDDEDGERPPKANKRRRKDQTSNGSAGNDEPKPDPAAPTNDVPTDTLATVGSTVEDETILAVHKIDSVQVDGKLYLVFSVVGATSIYLVECPVSADGREPVIEVYDVGKPVLDFCILSGAEDVPLIWISADVAWPYDAQTAGLVDLVQLVTVTGGKVSSIVLRALLCLCDDIDAIFLLVRAGGRRGAQRIVGHVECSMRS